MKLAPIVLFVYNRPWHTMQTVKGLLQNELAAQTDLIVYSDGPKSSKAKDSVEEVRKYIRSICRFRHVNIIEREENLGLARAITMGVTDVIEEYGRVIVMEDDMISSPYYLRYMNEALNLYNDEDKVMHIAGYTLPFNKAGLPETFFTRAPYCWGWATWKRAWKHFRHEATSLESIFTAEMKYRFNLDGSKNFWSYVEKNKKGLLDIWTIFWYTSIFLNSGLCLNAAHSMIDNIGQDGSGINCGRSGVLKTDITGEPVRYFERNIQENAEVLKRLRKFYRSLPIRRLQIYLRSVVRLLSKGIMDGHGRRNKTETSSL